MLLLSDSTWLLARWQNGNEESRGESVATWSSGRSQERITRKRLLQTKKIMMCRVQTETFSESAWCTEADNSIFTFVLATQILSLVKLDVLQCRRSQEKEKVKKKSKRFRGACTTHVTWTEEHEGVLSF